MSKYLFLDRDGVINERIPGAYVQEVKEFKFNDGCLENFSIFNQCFDRVFVVTNQQGIGKGIMTESDLQLVHNYMISELKKAGGHIDEVYFCPELAVDKPICRKPNPGMAFQAKNDFPEVDFTKSVIVGDSISDMLFGKRLGMETVLISSNPDQTAKASILTVDRQFVSLSEYSKSLL